MNRDPILTRHKSGEVRVLKKSDLRMSKTRFNDGKEKLSCLSISEPTRIVL